ncbi:unnamed protein product [Heligmosomoides polygyrus]|uniref:Histone-lysine N-methyltransferase SETMAR n=1 Tax=Heligmosomoides polygyrus TaxID=6339 RepID=A0A183FK31_HELPZ|nr:unnamed protein product [Heligmosomoides polygyrus]
MDQSFTIDQCGENRKYACCNPTNLLTSDYHLFRPLNHHLAGRKFTNYDNLKSDIAEFFESQPPEFWAKGIDDLPNRWATVVDNCGDYTVD